MALQKRLVGQRLLSLARWVGRVGIWCTAIARVSARQNRRVDTLPKSVCAGSPYASSMPCATPVSSTREPPEYDGLDHDSLTVIAVNGFNTKVGAPLAGEYGTLTLNADGTYTYVASNNFPILNKQLQDQFTYTV